MMHNAESMTLRFIQSFGDDIMVPIVLEEIMPNGLLLYNDEELIQLLHHVVQWMKHNVLQWNQNDVIDKIRP
jgi:hypothetical protein